MAIICFTETELRELLRVAKENNGDVRIEWRRFRMLVEAYVAHGMIRENLRESGIDVRFETGGAPHAVSRLIGEHMAIQRMGEGTGVVPKTLLDDAHQLYEGLAKKFESLTGEYVDLKKEFEELEKLYEGWLKWARQHNGISCEGSDDAMRQHIDRKGAGGTEELLEAWREWAKRLLNLFEGSAPRTDAAMRRHIDEKLERG